MIKYKDLTIITSENVYIPAEDSFLSSEVLEALISKSHSGINILDMGAGTGIIGLTAATNEKIGSVLLADINEDAVRICNENMAFNDAMLKAKCNIIKSDLFSEIKDRFDIIIFNAPYLRSEDSDKKEGDLAKAWSGGREGIETSVKFLEGAASHLKLGGKVILIASSLSSMDKLNGEIKRLGFKEDNRKKVHIFFEDIIAITLSKS